MKKILVAGATGRQGGAVARHLLRVPGFEVRALTRDPQKPAARALASLGAEVLKGDLNDSSSLKQAMEGVYGVFSVQNFFETGGEGEVRQGRSLADAALTAGVKHFIYSSVVSANRNTGLPHFETKWEIEQYLHGLRLPWTILRPAFYMENWYYFLRDPILQGTLPQPLDPHKFLQQIAVDDIGGFATMAFQFPEKWIGRTVELAGEELSMTQVADTFSRVLGQRVKYVQVSWEQFRQQSGEEITRMYKWFNDVGYHVDIAALRREYPALTTLEQVLRQQDWTKRQRVAA